MFRRNKGKENGRSSPPKPPRKTKEVRHLKDIDGCFVKGEGGWWMWFHVPLIHGFDWVSYRKTNEIFVDHARIFEALQGYEAQIDVLPVHVSLEERKARLRKDQGLSPLVSNDATWLRRRSQHIDTIAEMLAERGDYESRGYLGVKLNRKPPATSGSALVKIPRAERFGIERPSNAGLIPEAREIRTKIRSVWQGRMRPLPHRELVKFIMLATWPGQTDVQAPIRLGESTKDLDYELQFLSQTFVHECHPYEMAFDQFGQTSYATFMPMRLPDETVYEPHTNMEYGWQTDLNNDRVRFTWRFEVVPGHKLIKDAGKKKSDVLNHAEYHVSKGGEARDLQDYIEAAENYYDYLNTKSSLVVKGRPMIVPAAPSEETLRELRGHLTQINGSNRVRLITDTDLQRRLWRASIPGAKTDDAYVDPISHSLAAMAMPFITSRPPAVGPGYFGYTLGKEFSSYSVPLDISLRKNATEAPVWSVTGPSRRGKTTFVLDSVIELAYRAGYVCLVFDLAKFDLELVDASELPPGLLVNFVDVMQHPGSLNPAALAPRPEDRLHMMVDFFRNCIGHAWNEHDYKPVIQAACQFAINQAPDGIPDLNVVVDRLLHQRGGFEGGVERLLGSALLEISQNEAAVAFFPRPATRRLMDELERPGLHIIQQKLLRIPGAEIRPQQYSPAQNLAMAGLTLGTFLGFRLANAREIPVCIAMIEYHTTSRHETGAREADYLARTGAALQTITIYDTQLPTDLPEELRRQVTGFVAFTSNDRTNAIRDLSSMNVVPNEALVDQFMALKDFGLSETGEEDDLADGDDRRINKGAAFIRLPNSESVVAVQNQRFNVGTSFVTDAQERRDRGAPVLTGKG